MASLSPDKLVPSSNSSDVAWKEYRQALGRYLGRKQANQYFTKTWALRGGTNVKGNTAFLRDYLETVGLKVDTNGLQDIADFGDDIADGVGNFLTVGKWTGIAVLAIVLGGIATLVIAIARKPERIVLATPAGRAATLAGGMK